MEKAERGNLTSSQYMLLIACYVSGSVLLLSFMDNLVKQDAWTVIVFGFLASIPFILSYAYLMKRFPGNNVLEINEQVFGKVLGRIISALYVIYFLIMLSFNLRDLADFYVGFVMPDEPMAVFLVVAMLVSGYAIHKGILSIAKVAVFSLLFTVFTVALTSLLLVKDMDIGNFLPMLKTPKPALLQGIHIFTALPMCEAFVFMMVVPNAGRQNQPVRYTLGGVGIAALILLVISLRNTAVLGHSSSIFAGNSYQAVRLIDIAEFFTRVELFVAIGITLALFIKITVLYFAVVKGSSHVLGVKTFSALILPVGGIVVYLAFIAFDSTVSHAYVGMRYHAFFPLLFEFILPPATLLVSAIRGLPREPGGDGS